MTTLSDDDATGRMRAALHGEVAKVVVGQGQTVDAVLVAVAVGGHLLLEGPPGVAKSLLASAIGRACGLQTRRVQFTPDLLPSDLTGSLALRGNELVFREGPLFTNILLADEINRTPPKTQAALLEAMQERQVTIDGHPHPLPDPFVVLATENPIEYEGTYPLPEAQLDRFLMKLSIGYPSAAEEEGLLRLRHTGVAPAALDDVTVVGDSGSFLAVRAEADAVTVSDPIISYVAGVVRQTRALPSVSLGQAPGPPSTCWPRRRRGPGCVGVPTSYPTTSSRWSRSYCATGSSSPPRPSWTSSLPSRPCRPCWPRSPFHASDIVPPQHPPAAVAHLRAGLRPSRWAAVLVGAIALATITLRLPPVVAITLTAVAAGCVLTDMVFAFRARLHLERTELPTLARQVPHPYSASVDAGGVRSPDPATRTPRAGEWIHPRRDGTAVVAHLTGRHRGIHLLPPPVTRLSGPIGLATCDHTVGGPGTGDRPSRPSPGPPAGRAPPARSFHRGGSDPEPVGPGHRVRVDPGVRPRRRHPAGELAGHGTHRTTDDQSVPNR